ncbi:conserved hypothetical protein [Ricinus communis]|uniref:Uncharacterized protein n=1 Tax=Ricinus communis TaxID=3988 RepID=B9SK86_RICCO|nr:conserved hypothetical protein [Ricinus communis]
MMCVPKKLGGLGFKKLHEFNLAMVAKHEPWLSDDDKPFIETPPAQVLENAKMSSLRKSPNGE